MVAIKQQDKRILVTSALPYVNNVPHLGNIIGCVLSADVFARFQRSAGRETLYICGTDEHGTTTEAKAKEEGVSPQEICDKYFTIHKGVYDWFGISFDHFGRTSAPNHVTRTQELFKHLDAAGYVVEKTIQQLYSESAKTFLADRYVEGTCPHCAYEDARGDQCDNCGKLLTPTDLIDPRSKLDGSKPVIKETTHLFLDLAKMQPELENWAHPQSDLGKWSENAIRTTNAWFKEGLQPRAITRDLDWGVPVPKKGYEGKVFYVWFDAPIGYISITEQLLGDSWRNWWQKPNDVQLYQFMAKDNIPFHTILFPATLLGSEDSWTMLHHINSSEYLNYEDLKFSKSRGTGVFGDDAKETGLPADVFRYYLLINRPESSDTTFQWDDFGEKLNNEVVANFGNLVNRTISFINRSCDGVVDGGGLNEQNLQFWNRIQLEEQKVTDLLEDVKIKDALKHVMAISRLGNQYFQEQEPWKTIKTDEAAGKEALFVLTNLVKDLAILIEPFLPTTAQSLFKQLALEPQDWSDLGVLSVENHQIGKPELLFNKIEQKQLDAFKGRFSGRKSTESINIEEVFGPEKIDFRVARITNVEKHPKADKLFIEEIDVGPLGKRTIVSGLAGHYTPEELVGKQIILVANLKPAKLRGVESAGMLLAAENEGTVEVLFIDPDAAQPGDALTIEGLSPVSASEITIDDFFTLSYQVKNHEGLIEGKRLLVGGTPVKAKLSDGKIR